ncbi:MAG TPA: RNA methyltransferase [Candidatus Dormibacteraeota bacterium]|nr:RNA methyltransferase [Candidatus Dormibacteraeota bacterium]
MRAGRTQSSPSTAVDATDSTLSPITSKENQWLKRFRAALAGDSGEANVVGIEGPHLVEEALRSGVEILAVLVSSTGEKQLEGLGTAGMAAKQSSGLRILRTSDRLFASAAETRTPQGIAALVRLPEHSFEDVVRGLALAVVLIGVQDPGNVGALVRSAEALGASGMIAAAGTANPYGPKALRASAGSAFRLPILLRAQPPVLLAQLRVARVKLVAATSTVAGPGPHPVSPDRLDLRGPVALLIGSEAHGLPDEVLRSADAAVRIPLAAPVESLNAAIAASVILYEAARQRLVAEGDPSSSSTGSKRK